MVTNNVENVYFVECGADLEGKYRFMRKQFLWPNQVQYFSEHFNNTGVYNTVMHYINPQWIQDQYGKWIIDAEKSLKIGDFYLDFDRIIESEEDYIKIKEDVFKAIRYLKVILSIEENQIQLFFSGNKGLHLTVDHKVIGIEPSFKLNQVYREIAKDIEEFCENETLDTRIYDNKRMFRITNTINKSSGLYKIPITHEEFKGLTHKEVSQLARNPREIERPILVYSPKANRAFKELIIQWEEMAERQLEYSGKIKALNVLPPCIVEMNTKLFRETIDERNNSGTALASFYHQQGLERGDTLQRLIKWGEENCSPALKRRDVEVIVNSIYNNQYRYGCQTFKDLSGVCDRDKCPLFNPEYNKIGGPDEETEKQNETEEKNGDMKDEPTIEFQHYG